MKSEHGPELTNQTDVVERTVAYSLRVINLYRELKSSELGRVLGRQVLRSGTSIGANVHEAQGAQSKSDFVARIHVAYKEAHETSYWLRIIQESHLIDSSRCVRKPISL